MWIKGKVRGLGTIYSDGIESQEIHFTKDEASKLPYVEGKRVQVTLTVDGADFEAGLRATQKCEYVWISPNLMHVGTRHRLAYVLARAGFVKNEEIKIRADGERLLLNKVLTTAHPNRIAPND